MLMSVFVLVCLMSLFFMYSMLEMVMALILLVFFVLMKMDLMSMGFNFVGIFMNMDLMGLMLIELSLWISLLMFMASMSLRIFYEEVFSFYVVLMLLFLVLCFSVNNLIFFYLCFESVLFPIIMIIMGWGMQPERLQAGLYMLFYTLFGSFPLLVFILFFESNLSMVYLYWLEFEVGFVLMMMGVIGFLVSMPMYFLHIWLPKAHVEAPVAGSMILAAVLLKLGIYGIFRMIFFFIQEFLSFGYFFMSVVLLGSLIISMVCLCQVDVKALIAYSSVCHMGVAFGGVVSLSNWGFMGNLVMMLGHGLCSSGLFCLANLYYERIYTRSMVLLKGVGMVYPFMSLWWFLFSVVNMAAPPSMNLGGEIFLIGAIIKWSLLGLVPLGMVSFVAAAYSLYMYSYVNHGSGWVIYAGKMLDMRELMLLFFHMIPLIIWVLKMEFFLGWF
uniref:NADH dehydrogenase subunit 4 n=1 Tax=Ornithodoros noorsveldensis TaxID=1580573 RepID=UPI000738F832|nr:NADH dehydrogenase subunit 4 [Ornithodoros noorsveldensis]AIZ58706.1 NADH dehydrogenase subunit 4 [Ornithodoros noorsveldensis]AIZ58719.1 NADH dehydrogenase subunit 4 [Ornithodoros noorsveldensis]UYB78491.1 NADH dehydrogenase subunit 4 [Ornithodoros noorsveldensis]